MKIKFLILPAICMLSFSTSWAALPELSCFITDNADDSALKQKEEFNTNAAMIYLICTSDEVKEGQKIKAVWTAANTNGVAPNNYKIGEKSFDVSKEMDEKKDWSVKYSLSKPYTGWPSGQYHVDLLVDGMLAKSIKFEVSTK